MANRRSLFMRNQVTKFVTLFVERAGSTYLSTLLNSHPDILSLGEQLVILTQNGADAETQLSWTKEFLTPPIIGRNKARGFKTKHIDILDPIGFSNLIQELGCKIILLQRHNSIKAVVSTINAKRLWEKSGYWNLLNEENRMSTSFYIDPDKFDELLQTRLKLDTEIEEYVKNMHLPTLALHYEDLLQDENDFLKLIYSFLNVKPKSAKGITKKNTKDDLREVIQNFDELQVKYKNTEFEPMFEEVLVP